MIALASRAVSFLLALRTRRTAPAVCGLAKEVPLATSSPHSLSLSAMVTFLPQAQRSG